MNPAQRVVLIIGFLVVLGMALFPPWKRLFEAPNYDLEKVVHVEQSAGYHLILLDQSSGSPYVTLRIDTTRLEIQFIAVLILISLLYFILRPTQK